MCRTSSPTFVNRPSPLAPTLTANASAPWSRNHACHCARSQSEYASRSSRLNAKAIVRPRTTVSLQREVYNLHEPVPVERPLAPLGIKIDEGLGGDRLVQRFPG